MNGWDIMQMVQVELSRCLLIGGLQKFSAIKGNGEVKMNTQQLYLILNKLSKVLKVARLVSLIPITIIGLAFEIFISIFLSGTICWWLAAFEIISENNKILFYVFSIIIFLVLLVYSLTEILRVLENKLRGKEFK